jgi:hypothetical protein
MALPAEQILLVDSNGTLIDVDTFQRERILVDDEVGLVVYVGGLGIYSLKPTEGGEFLAAPVTEISRPRFSAPILRRQIGATVLSVTADAVFVVKEGDILKKVRAEKLVPGMVLASGEKVYR